jgi:hypothetical protein
MQAQQGTYPTFLEKYINLAPYPNVIDALEKNLLEVKNYFLSMPLQKENHAYAKGKWTIKQLLNHCSDTERIFAYRALRFARKDEEQPLSFDENLYAQTADVSHRSLADILEEFITIRQATIALFKSFSNQTLLNMGNTAAGKVSVLALGFAMCGHVNHHINVVKERYL